MLRGFVGWIKAIWTVANSPGNDPVIVGLVLASFAMLCGYSISFWRTSQLLKEKDKRIEDLVQERNRLHDVLLAQVGTKRQTTLKGKKE